MLFHSPLTDPGGGPFSLPPMSPASEPPSNDSESTGDLSRRDPSGLDRGVSDVGGDPAALFETVRAELSRMAKQLMARQPAGHTLQATALVNEAYLRMARQSDAYQDRPHFLRVAAQAMRQILVDSGRRRRADKRPPQSRRVTLDVVISLPTEAFEERAGGLEELHLALEQLEEVDPSLAEFVELRFFGGQTMAACAEILGLSERQAFRRWRAARAFLARDIEQRSGNQP